MTPVILVVIFIWKKKQTQTKQKKKKMKAVNCKEVTVDWIFHFNGMDSNPAMRELSINQSAMKYLGQKNCVTIRYWLLSHVGVEILIGWLFLLSHHPRLLIFYISPCLNLSAPLTVGHQITKKIAALIQPISTRKKVNFCKWRV